MIIRKAHAADADTIARVHFDSSQTTYTGIVPDEILATKRPYEERRQYWRGFLSTPEPAGFAHVAVDNDVQVIGFTSGGQEHSGGKVYKGELYTIYLLERYHRRGLGRQLVEAATKELLHRGLASMLIWVLAANPSRAFYVALGGQQVLERENMIWGIKLPEVAYGWKDIRPLAAMGK